MSEPTVEALSCQELVELVTDYLESTMAPADRARFEKHIAGCDGCTAYLEQMRATIRLAGRLTPEAVPPEAERALLSAFRSWARA
jgi:anti-sigma factor RsiW